MTFQELRPREAVTLTTILQHATAEALPKRERLVTYVHDMYEFHAFEGSLTLVMNRDLNIAAKVASAVALHTAMKFPDRNVLLLNSFASNEMLTSGFVQALHLLKVKIPWTYQRFLPDAKKDAFDDSTQLPEPKNLFVLDCPTSTLTPELIEQQIARCRASVVLLNSLDFAAFDDRHKRQLAETLLTLRERLNISLFVFTHEVRPLLPHTGGRGIVGLLSAFSDSIWPLLHEWELKKWATRFNFNNFHEPYLHTRTAGTPAA
jgi:hypothetical protein